METSTIEISVVICTYNRADLLVTVLDSLCQQKSPPEAHEILVIDNNSTDTTLEIARDFSARFPQVRYCLESQLGLSNARNRGWQEARGEYIAYLDDDCKVPPEWLATAHTIIQRHAPAVFGGPYFAFYNSAKPQWFNDAYGSHDLGEQARPLTSNEYLSGGNIFFRRAHLHALAGFDARLGMYGRRIAYGEETAFLIFLRAVMPEQLIYYDPQLYVYHLVRPEKMTIPWLIVKSFATGRYSYRVFEGQSPTVDDWFKWCRTTLSTLGSLSIALVFGAISRDRTKYPFFENYFYEYICRRITKMGALYEQFFHLQFHMK